MEKKISNGMKPQKPSDILPPTLLRSETIEDLIERKRKNLEAIFDAVPVGLLLIDENLFVVRVNDTTRRLIKKDYNEIINKSPGDALNCQTIVIEKKPCGQGEYCKKCPLRQNIQKALDTSQPLNEFEFQSQTFFQDRNIKPWFALSIEPVTIEGRKHVVVCLNDITERKLAEEKLAETMEMKSQFISTVSHELRTPLSAVKEGLNIVLEGVAGKLNAKQKQFLELSKRNVDRLNALVSDVLDFQKLESGKMEFNFATGDLAQTVKEAAEPMTLAAKKAKVDMSVEIKPDGCQAVFDHNKIIQLITNLLSNAIKFTPPGGKITLAVQPQNDEIIITVSDTGMGIPKKDLPPVFGLTSRISKAMITAIGAALKVADFTVRCSAESPFCLVCQLLI
jgi:nitrogen fixation/metabolism regulation signal transduction histidine kinase